MTTLSVDLSFFDDASDGSGFDGDIGCSGGKVRSLGIFSEILQADLPFFSLASVDETS